MRPVLFHIGDVAVPSFWVMAFLAFFVGFLVVRRDMIMRGYDVRLAYDITLWAYIGGWVGARLFLIPTGWDYFVEDPIAFLISGSGWVWYGGVVGGAVAVGLWARWTGLSILVVSDVVAPALAIGLAIGRIGCQLSGDGDYGVPSDLPWAMSYPDGVVPTVERVHPAPIYEMILYFVIFAVLRWQRGRSLPNGNILGQYLVYSGVARFAVEFVRRNPTWLLGLTTAQVMALGGALIGLYLMRRR